MPGNGAWAKRSVSFHRLYQSDHDDGAFRHRPVLRLPRLDVLDGAVIALVRGHLVVDVDDDERPDRIGRRQVADRRAVLVPVGRRVELGPVLVGGQLIGGGHEPVIGIGVFLAGLHIALDVRACDRRLELGMAEARPDRDGRAERMGQVDILGLLQRRLVDFPEPGLLRQDGGAELERGDEGDNGRRGDGALHMASL